MLKQIFSWNKKSNTEDLPVNEAISSPTSDENKISYELDPKNQIQDLEEEIKAIKIQLLKSSKQLEAYDELVSSISELLKKMEVHSINAPYVKKIKNLIHAFDQQENETFHIHLEDLHRDYIRRLKLAYPKLTLYDVKLGLYIKMGLSTKEIASLLNVLPSSINVSRSRLRKKLQLQTREDLFLALDKI